MSCDHKTCRSSCKRWLCHHGLQALYPVAHTVQQPLLLSVAKSTNNAHAYDAWLGALADVGDDLAITCEDKDSSVIWLQLKHCLFFRWFQILERSDRWQIVSHNSSDVLQYYRTWFDGCLPNFLLTGKTSFAHGNIPLVYPTIKRKCYSGLQEWVTFLGCNYPCSCMSTCQKPQHSCMRNVVTFARFPGKQQLRAVSRALRHLYSKIFVGWAVDNLAKAADNVRAAFAGLSACPDSGRCVGCGSMLFGPTIKIFDAGQAYEMVSLQSVHRDIDLLLRRAVELNMGIVQVFKTARALVAISRSLQRGSDDRTVLVSASIQRCVEAYLKFRIYRLGDRFVEQTTGVPIGGFMSSSLLGLVLSAAEARFDSCGWPRWCEQRGVLLSRSSCLALLRYEDDLLAMSHTLCGCCVKDCVLSAYSGEAAFEENLDHEVADCQFSSNKFLDMIIKLTGQDCTIDLHIANLDFLDSTDPSCCPSKFRFAPPIGENHAVLERLAQNFMSRRARWCQLGLSPRQIVTLAAMDFLELSKYGYKGKCVLDAWYKSRDHHPSYAIGLQVLRSVMPVFNEATSVWRVPSMTLEAILNIFGIDPNSFPCDPCDLPERQRA